MLQIFLPSSAIMNKIELVPVVAVLMCPSITAHDNLNGDMRPFITTWRFCSPSRWCTSKATHWSSFSTPAYGNKQELQAFPTGWQHGQHHFSPLLPTAHMLVFCTLPVITLMIWRLDLLQTHVALLNDTRAPSAISLTHRLGKKKLWSSARMNFPN